MTKREEKCQDVYMPNTGEPVSLGGLNPAAQTESVSSSVAPTASAVPDVLSTFNNVISSAQQGTAHENSMTKAVPDQFPKVSQLEQEQEFVNFAGPGVSGIEPIIPEMPQAVNTQPSVEATNPTLPVSPIQDSSPVVNNTGELNSSNELNELIARGLQSPAVSSSQTTEALSQPEKGSTPKEDLDKAMQAASDAIAAYVENTRKKVTA